MVWHLLGSSTGWQKYVHVKGLKKKHYIRDKISEVTRFLIQVRQQEGMDTACLKDSISPLHCSTCLTAAKQLAGFDQQTASYRTPSLAVKLGHELKEIGQNFEKTSN